MIDGDEARQGPMTGNALLRYDLTVLRLLFLAVLACFALAFLFYPLGFTLAKAFFVADGSGGSRFTFSVFLLMLTDPANWELILNSINLALAVTLLTTLLAVPMAWVMNRYEFPLKGLMTGLLLVPLVLPPFVGAVGMKQMFARFGSINLLLLDSGLIREPVDWLGGGFWAVVILEVLHLYPILYMSVAAAMANIDPNMEEAARNLGASGLRLFRRITWPLMLPGYFAGAIIVFIWSLTDLGTPLILDYRNLIPVRIFNMLTDINQNPMGYCLVLFMILLTAGFFYLSKVTLGGRGYAMTTRGHVASLTRPAGGIGSALILLGLGLITLLAVIPHISVVLTSISGRWFMTVLPTAYTDAYYFAVFQQELTWLSIKNSLFLSSLSTVVDILLGVSIAWMLLRTRIPGKNVVDTLTMMPLAIPGIIMAFGYLTAFANTPLDAAVNPIPLLVIGYCRPPPALHGPRRLRRLPADRDRPRRGRPQPRRRPPDNAPPDHACRSSWPTSSPGRSSASPSRCSRSPTASSSPSGRSTIPSRRPSMRSSPARTAHSSPARWASWAWCSWPSASSSPAASSGNGWASSSNSGDRDGNYRHTGASRYPEISLRQETLDPAPVSDRTIRDSPG